MILEFFRKFNSRSFNHIRKAKTLIPPTKHAIKRSHISVSAKKTIKALQKAGHEAFIVGGAVRDLLLGFNPKDFDIATDAKPEEVRAIFKRSKIIGRRFRLVHVYFGREILEISTFRANALEDPTSTFLKDKKGRILRDNVFGTQKEDALRRDFTVNALFYNPEDEMVLDFCGGYSDLVSQKLRIIGKPDIRFREDPVRILRAVRFSSKLHLQVEEKSLRSMRLLKNLLLNVPPSRLFEETLKILFCGNAVKAIENLYSNKILNILLPEVNRGLDNERSRAFLMLAVAKTDERVGNNQRNSPAFIFAAIFWHEILSRWEKKKSVGKNSLPALIEAIDKFSLTRRRQGIDIPRRFELDMRNIWLMQARFLKRNGRQPFALLRATRFRAGYDFMLLRCETGEVEESLGHWWRSFQMGNYEERLAMTTDNKSGLVGHSTKKNKKPVKLNNVNDRKYVS